MYEGTKSNPTKLTILSYNFSQKQKFRIPTLNSDSPTTPPQLLTYDGTLL